jgi:hypothetical protein
MSSNPSNRVLKEKEKQQILQGEYSAYFQDIEDVIIYKDIVANFRKSRIIKGLVKLGFLNKF